MSDTALQTINGGVEFTLDQIELIKNTVAQGTTDDELKLFLYTAKKRGLDPLAKQIHAIKRWNKDLNCKVMAVQVGIDGYRAIAERTGQYAGNDDYEFDGETNGIPGRAKATVYRIVAGQRVPFSASARWKEYYPGDKTGFMWNKMPHVMLGKVAEALAFRKAFPQDLSGLYIPEEMDQANEQRQIEPKKPETVKPEPKKLTFIERAGQYSKYFEKNNSAGVFKTVLADMKVKSVTEIKDAAKQKEFLGALKRCWKEVEDLKKAS